MLGSESQEAQSESAEDLREGDQRQWLGLLQENFPSEFQVSKALGIKSSRKETRKVKFKMLERWKGLFSLESPFSSPSGRQERKAVPGEEERASEKGLLGQLNQRNYFPTDEAKKILMAFPD